MQLKKPQTYIIIWTLSVCNITNEVAYQTVKGNMMIYIYIKKYKHCMSQKERAKHRHKFELLSLHEISSCYYTEESLHTALPQMHQYTSCMDSAQ